MRTEWMFQVFIASMEAWSTGPSHMPLPWTQANSPPEWFTPRSRYVAPLAVTRWLPETCSAGAVPYVGVTVGVGVGEGSVVTVPSQTTPLTVKVAGTGSLAVNEPTKP